MKSAVKDVKKLVAEKKPTDARELLSAAYKAIDKAAKRGVIKKNAAARKKSRLSAMIKKAG
jgi:small subunit ribosomal protein S20